MRSRIFSNQPPNWKRYVSRSCFCTKLCDPWQYKRATPDCSQITQKKDQTTKRKQSNFKQPQQNSSTINEDYGQVLPPLPESIQMRKYLHDQLAIQSSFVEWEMSSRRTRTADNGRFPIMSDVKCVPRLLQSNQINFVSIGNTIEAGGERTGQTHSYGWEFSCLRSRNIHWSTRTSQLCSNLAAWRWRESVGASWKGRTPKRWTYVINARLWGRKRGNSLEVRWWIVGGATILGISLIGQGEASVKGLAK